MERHLLAQDFTKLYKYITSEFLFYKILDMKSVLKTSVSRISVAHADYSQTMPNTFQHKLKSKYYGGSTNEVFEWAHQRYVYSL